MKTALTYYHTRNLFTKNEFKSFVNKYFKDVRFIGTECGNNKPMIEVSNYDEVKNILPKHAIPLKAEMIIPNKPTVIEWLGLGLASYKTRIVKICK